jgi:phosphatidylserine/phosphatidylglycerophosphate/cardiolipin synthase-like enzyme
VRAPVRLLLDGNRVHVGDGTPNTQSARYIMERAREEGLNLEVRWYCSSGEQNHAKAMTITAPRAGKHQLTLGSANWTRKSLAGINLEANLFVEGAEHVNREFNDLFDRMWANRDGGIEYSRAYDDPSANDGWSPWTIGWALVLRLPLIGGEPIVVERDLVHW